jgi:hypothetical protein
MLALYRRYPLQEFDEVGHVLSRLQRAFGDVEPFNHPMLADFEEDDGEAA